MSSDVLIIGGGPAGLSAAMSLGRMSQTAVVCDDDRPRNAPAAHMNNFPSRDGMNPHEWRNQVRRELEKYPTISFLNGSVLSMAREGREFVAGLSDQSVRRFKKIILASGVRDRLPEIPGLQELWGQSVFHCPYCHGFEVRGQRLGLVANGEFAKHLVPMVYSLSSDLILFSNAPAELSSDFRKGLRSRGIRLVEDELEELKLDGANLQSVLLSSGESIERDGLFWAPSLPFELKSSLGAELGCERTEMGFLKTDGFGKTSVDGVFAAGDIATPMHSVLAAAAAGQLAGAGVASELLSERFLE